METISTIIEIVFVVAAIFGLGASVKAFWAVFKDDNDNQTPSLK
jgi:hypothetical protein